MILVIQRLRKNEMYEEVCRLEIEQPKQKSPVARPIETPHLVKGVARSEHHTPRNNEVKREDLED